MKVVLFALVAFGFLGLASSDSCEDEVEKFLDHLKDWIEQSGDDEVDSDDQHKMFRGFDSNGDQIFSRREFVRGILEHAKMLAPIAADLFAELGGSNGELTISALRSHFKQMDADGLHSLVAGGLCDQKRLHLVESEQFIG